MSEHNRRTDLSVLIAIGLIALGMWLLAERALGPLWTPVREALRFATSVAWPLAIIALGILILLAGKRGTIGQIDVRGKRLYRSRSERMIGGVLGGLGAYLGVDPTWARIVYVLAAFVTGLWPAFVLDVVAMIVIPEEPIGGQAPPETSWPQTGRETVQEPTPPPPPVPPAPPANQGGQE